MIDKFKHKVLRVPYKLNAKIVRKGRNPKATIIFLHGLASTNDLWKDLIQDLPNDIRILSVDLLGHGKSPRPNWSGAQTLSMQAHALRRTLVRTGSMVRPVILVGHSLGALISAEFAKQFPDKVDSIILISPPIYRPDDKSTWPREKVLKKGYNFLVKNQQISSKFAKFATKNFVKGAEEIETNKDFNPIIESLEVAILGQNSFQTLQNLKVNTKIIYGVFDPLVIGKNIRIAAKYNANLSFEKVPGMHDIAGLMKKNVLKTIGNNIKKEKNE